MDEFTADAFVDGDELPSEDIDYTQSSVSHNAGEKPQLSAGSQDVNTVRPGGRDAGSSAGLSLQDRLFARLLQQIISSGEAENSGTEGGTVKRQPRYPSRPPFSLPVMTNNFRRFNARIGIAFDFQNQLIRLFSWRAPIQTISFMCVYSFVCLDPYLLVILPLASLLLFIMVPAFLARHPPPPSTSTAGSTPFYSYQGPALAPAKTIKPASETSKDFFHNMRDLQNCMADISNIHDATISFISPPTNFSDEVLSSTLFLVLSVVTASLFLAAHLLPWRFIFLIGGNAAVISGHPTVQDLLQFFSQQALENGSQDPGKSATDPPPGTVKVLGLSLPSSPSSFLSLLEATADVSLDSYPEEREVEIYELQYRSLSPYSTSPEWETIVFSPTPYDPLSPSRIAGNRPRGCRFFEDVQSPSGWAWKGKKWQLDLDCREWVVERMITGVGFEVLGNSASEGEMSEVGGWVWDLPPTGPQTQNEDGEVSLLAYGDLNDSRSAAKSEQRGNGKGKAKDSRGSFSQDWEFDSTSVHGMGEWRRRRWVRIVQRVSVDKEKGNDTNRDI